MGLFANIKAWFSPLLAKFRAFLKEIFKGAVELALAALQDIANQVVQEIANDPKVLTDEEKRKAAFSRIKNYAADRGLIVKDSLINLAIELAVTYWKNKE